jgi:hypothetical protein
MKGKSMEQQHYTSTAHYWESLSPYARFMALIQLEHVSLMQARDVCRDDDLGDVLGTIGEPSASRLNDRLADEMNNPA